MGVRRWIAALWLLGGCGDDSGAGGSAGGTEGTTGADESTGDSEAPPVEPNIMPEGHVIPVPESVQIVGSSVADYDDDGRNEMVAADRYDTMSLGVRYEVYRLDEAQTTIARVSAGSYSDYDRGGSIYPVRQHDGPGLDAVRISTAYSGDPGFIPLIGGQFEEPLFRTMADPMGSPSDVDGDGWSELAVPLDDRIQLFESDGAGSFNVAVELPLSCDAIAILHAPLDPDSDDDLVVVEDCPEGPIAHVYLDDTGPIGPAQTVDLSCTTYNTFLVDLDGDPYPDLVVLCEYDIEVHLGTSAGTFTDPITIAPTHLALRASTLSADFDGDGLHELLVDPADANLPSTAPRVLLTLADDGSLTTSDFDDLEFLLGVAGDINGDHCEDLYGLVGATPSLYLSHCD